jgi:hypothetical protein
MSKTQREILSEGFWDLHKSPILKGIGKAAGLAGGAVGAAVKGTAKALDYVAPEITQPLHNLERGAREIKDSIRQGYDVGSGGLRKAYADILLDAGYIMTSDKIVRTGKNKIVFGRRIIGKDRSGKPIGDPKKLLSFLFNDQNEFKIVTSDAQDTSKINRRGNPKIKKK